MKIIALLVLLIGFSACVTVSTSPNTSSKKPVEKLPDTSPSQIVSGYLEALKKGDFQKAYDFVSIGYAGNFDKQGYEVSMKQDLIEKRHWSLLNYQVSGAQIFGNEAFVTAELEVKYKLTDSEKEIQKKIRVQYRLNILEKKWKISSDKVLE